MPRCAATAVHPRVCGEHNSIIVIDECQHGSSPRMRGTLTVRTYREVRRRFIPAYAGNTSSCLGVRQATSVHPRVCGEHSLTVISLEFKGGSSPRMRGTHDRQANALQGQRFIPAYAGNTRSSAPDRAGRSGSSPRMRGTLRALGPPGEHLRFIPAYAGNTRRSRKSERSRPVHPRVCGEHIACSASAHFGCGSSPRMRGTLFADRHALTLGRFIPAYAGNTAGRRSRRGELAVHPRVCGEHCTVVVPVAL